MEYPKDSLVCRRKPGRWLSRRDLLAQSAAGTLAAATDLFTACSADNKKFSPGQVLFHDAFAGRSLNRDYWNPYICDNNSNGKPWLTQRSVAVASSAIAGPNDLDATYNLPNAIGVDDGLTLTAYRGTRAAGYSWTGSVICSHPTSNDLGSGTVRTTGFTFADARVEVRAKMPDLTGGQWPAIWFLPAPGAHGAEIDLFEGGFVAGTIDPNHVMAANLFTGGNRQQVLDCRTDLSAGYHTYAMEYRQGKSIRFFLDDSNVYTYTRNVPTGSYFIILSHAIASARAAGWHTQVSNSTPAVNLMQVSEVRVLAL